jgi:hypothetical protein
MVQREQGRLRRGGGQFGVQPRELVGVERARGAAGDRRVKGDEAQRAELGGIAHGLRAGSGDAELRAQRGAIVMIAGDHVQRRSDGGHDLAHGGVLRGGAML